MRLEEIAAKLGLEVRGSAEVEVLAPAPVEFAGPGTITFVVSAKFLSRLQNRRPAAVIAPPELASKIEVPVLLSSNPYADFARVIALLVPVSLPPPGIHPTAVIEPGAELGDGAYVGPYSIVGANTRIGRRAVIHAHVTIYPEVTIGDDFVCHSQVSIREGTVIGSRVTIHCGAVLGADGFGFVEDRGELVKIPQIGRVVIEDDVEIGANAAIDRATVGTTVIRRGVKLDNMVHIGHNCDIGPYSRFAAQVGVAGSSRTGAWCEFGGQVGIADHARIGDRVRVVAQSGIPNDVADGAVVGGTPAVDIHVWRRMVAALPRLPDLVRRLRRIERKLGVADD